MKAFLYAGATLMIGASIYGFVAYKQTENKKEFKSMYVEEKQPAPITSEPAPPPAVKEAADKNVTEEKIAITKAVEKTAAATVVKKTKKKKRLDARLFSRAPLREDLEEIPPAPKTEDKLSENKVQ